MFLFSFHVNIHWFLVFISHSWVWNSLNVVAKGLQTIDRMKLFRNFYLQSETTCIEGLHGWQPEDDLYIELLSSPAESMFLCPPEEIPAFVLRLFCFTRERKKNSTMVEPALPSPWPIRSSQGLLESIFHPAINQQSPTWSCNKISCSSGTLDDTKAAKGKLDLLDCSCFNLATLWS